MSSELKRALFLWIQETGIPPPIALSSEHVNDNGIYLLENGEDCLIYVGNSVNPDVLQKLFGFSSVDQIPTQVISYTGWVHLI